MPARQEVLNVVLAQLLAARGLVAAPEQRITRRHRAVSLPDVIVDFQGLRLAIEAEVGRKRAALAYQKASQRVESALAHVGVAVVYPSRLAETGFDRLQSEMEQATIQFAVVTEVAVTNRDIQLQLFPTEASPPEFESGTVDDLADSLRRAYDQLVQDVTLESAVQLLETAIDEFLAATETQPASLRRFGAALEVGDTRNLTGRQLTAIGRIGALIIANAMIFQEVLSQRNEQVSPLGALAGQADAIGALRRHWQFILDEINYFPIFSTAVKLLESLSAGADIERAVERLVKAADKIVRWRASLRHDLAGRIYHRLLEESKHLGAYYTSIPSATLLLKLAMPQRDSNVEWADLEALREYRIADLACGTGTLLMAAADVAVDNHIRAKVAAHEQPNLDELHDILVGNVIYGYDVLASAVHLTASTLTLRIPDRPMNVTHLYRLPLGGAGRALGTLDFLEEATLTGTVFGQAEQMTGGGPAARHVTIPKLDLCVMNPPFVRSVGGNLLFGTVPEPERGLMQNRLRGLIRSRHISASITAGLGAVFVALADRSLKASGKLALVLPRTLISGVAWSKTRQLIAAKYELEYLVVSHEPDHWNFSENTELSEVLAIARKKSEGEEREGHSCICVNLWSQPKNAIESLAFANAILGAEPVSDGDSVAIDVHGRQVGEVLAVPWEEMRREESWGQYCSCAQGELIRALVRFQKKKLRLPRASTEADLPLCELSTLGDLGFDRRDIHDGFDRTADVTSYPALWGHAADEIQSIGVQSNAYLRPLTRARAGRPRREADHLWGMSSRVMISERLWLITMRVVAVRLDAPALANVWWPFVLKGMGNKRVRAEKALVLWLNSTLGLLSLLGIRQETRGAWIDFKKPALKSLLVLDVREISDDQLGALAEAYDRLSRSTLEPYSELAIDPVRAAMDEAVSSALGLPDLRDLRNLLAREPILNMEMRHTMPEDVQDEIEDEIEE